MHQRRQRPHVIRQLFAGIPQSLNLGLGRRIADRQAPDVSIGVPQRNSRLIGPGGLEDRRHSIEPDLASSGPDHRFPGEPASVGFERPLRDAEDEVALQDRAA